jgi:hypothetical protein
LTISSPALSPLSLWKANARFSTGMNASTNPLVRPRPSAQSTPPRAIQSRSFVMWTWERLEASSPENTITRTAVVSSSRSKSSGRSGSTRYIPSVTCWKARSGEARRRERKSRPMRRMANSPVGG